MAMEYTDDQLIDFISGKYDGQTLGRAMTETLKNDPDGQIARFIAELDASFERVFNPDPDNVVRLLHLAEAEGVFDVFEENLQAVEHDHRAIQLKPGLPANQTSELTQGWQETQSLRRKDRTPRRAWLVGVIGTMAVLIALFAWNSIKPPSREIVLDDGGRRLIYENNGVTGLVGALSESTELVARAFRDKLNLSVALSLRGGPRTQRSGSDDEDSFDLLGPDGIAVRSDRPTFRWQLLPGAESYEVTVVDSNGEIVARGQNLPPKSKEMEWSVPQEQAPLLRGGEYKWQAAAIRRGESILSPLARFRVVPQHELNHLIHLEAQNPPIRLALGAAYAEYGLMEDALREFKELEKVNPQTPVIQRLIRQIEGLLKSTAKN